MPEWALARSPGCFELSSGIPAQLQNADTTVNAHGRRLLQICEDTALVLCIGKTTLNVPAQPSFKARSNTQTSRLDHVIVDAELFHAIQSCTVGPARADSDHHPLQLQLRLAIHASAPQLLPRPLLPTWRWDPALRDSYMYSLSLARLSLLKVQLRPVLISMRQPAPLSTQHGC